MYSTVSSLHIELDSRLQQLNSNRKQSIHPEQYDMCLNDAVLTIVKQRSSAKLNSKKEGFEESIKRYDDLEILKKDYFPLVNYKDSKLSFELPSDYLSYTTLVGRVKYNKLNLPVITQEVRKYVTIVDFSNHVFNGSAINFTIGGIVDNVSKFSSLAKSKKSSFYFYNLVCEYFKSKHNIDCYFESYDNKYYPQSLIFVSDSTSKQVTDCSATSTVSTISSVPLTNLLVSDEEPHIDMGIRKLDLSSSLNDAIGNNDHYSSKNLHLNPTFVIKGGKAYIATSVKFTIEGLTLEYIKKPRLIDYRIDQMTDITITDEVLDLTVTNILGILKDESYQISANKEQFNN